LWLLGYEPENFPFIWPALRESTKFEEIEERKGQAEVDEIYVNMGVLHPEEVRNSRFSTPETNLDQTIIDPELDKMIDNDEDDDPGMEEKDAENEREEENNRADMVDDDEAQVREFHAYFKEERIAEPKDIEVEDDEKKDNISA
jgi:hypothetical protein